MIPVTQQRADQRHKWAIIVSIKREERKPRRYRREPKARRHRPRYARLGEQT